MEEATRIDREGGGVVTYSDKILKVNDIVFADDGFSKCLIMNFSMAMQQLHYQNLNQLLLPKALQKDYLAIQPKHLIKLFILIINQGI